MKVIQVIPNLLMGGAEIMCENLTLELKNMDIDVKIVSLYSYETPITERLKENGVEIIFLDKKPGMDLSIIKKLKKVFDREKPDVVHSHISSQKYAMPAAKKSKVPVRVHTVHNVAQKELTKIDKFLAKRFYKKQGVIPVALSEAVKETVAMVYGNLQKEVPVVFNGINLSKCIKKESYGVEGNLKIVHIGRFSEQKNHKGLIDAFKIFNSQRPESELWLIGDGPKREEMEEYVKENNLTSSVKFLGLQSNVYGFLHEADIFTLPSIYEGIPMTLIEAMGTALPIVATNVGGIPDMITDNESGILTRIDAKEIADAFLRLSNDEELRKKLGQNALYRSQAFSSVEMAKKYIEIYKGEQK